ncbi:hypothetical protein ScPMuIL_010956 [Solemya velum]
MDDFDGEMCLDEMFEKAASKVIQMAAFMDSENMLYFYARYKQAKEGPCKVSKPGLFDFKGKQKWEAWKKLADMEKETAMLEYIALLSSLEPGWESEMMFGGDSLRMGIAVSKMSCPDEVISNKNKTVFDWCKEGKHKEVEQILTNRSIDVNDVDDDGLCLLHWACDRGYDDMVKVLLDHKADIDQQDGDKQTALHYAVSCEHVPVVSTLLARGASTTLVDCDGLTPLQLDTAPEVQRILQEAVK